MTSNEVESLLRYMLIMYPSVKMTNQQFSDTVRIWTSEFSDEECQIVGEAFRIARAESPDWIPSIPRIQKAIHVLKSKLDVKSKEQEFADSHCGKSEEEWKRLIEWERSKDGAEKINQFKSRLKSIFEKSDAKQNVVRGE